ncbi:Uncharacterised protein [Mycobacteroides abscessus subsp. abscessus]|nr:Uncharacterised protein [Mycobacteroides abscessus subsp. abscessus]
MPTIARNSLSVTWPGRSPKPIVVRPSRTQAVIISNTPIQITIVDSAYPCPNRNHDRCSASSSGSRLRTLPAPKPPKVIISAPRKPSRAAWPSGLRAKSA